VRFFAKLFGTGGDNPADSERAKELFNHGVAASLDAAELLSSGDVERAKGQSRHAIDQFRMALKLVPKSSTFAGALGHELHVLAATFGEGDFNEAQEFLLKAVQLEPDNVAFLCDLGLCRANLGDLPGAQENFQRVCALNESRETREHIATAMADIGQRAFDYGTKLQSEGQEQQGVEYKRFAIGASMLACRTHDMRRDLARQVSVFARDIGDSETADEYAAIASG
jgi:tetratricopeptide (TPR) repeat protein